MSEPSQEARGLRARASRWNARRRGRGTLKAAYTQAARDVKRMDPAVRERIGRANLTKSDLQQLAGFHVDAQFRPGRYGDMSQRLGQAANNRLQQAGPAPRQPRISRTRNPARALYNRYSRWGRNQRRGTKALKAALKQAARDVKRTDPAVQLAIGRSTLNSADLAALAAGRMDQVFRPEGRFQGTPAQQQQQGRGQQGRGQAQGAGVQSPDAVRQGPAQSEQMTQRIIALQQSILENQQRQMTLMEENNRLQAQMRQMLEARVQQLQQQVEGGEQAVSPPELTQQPEMDPARQSPEGQQPQRENTDDHVRLDNPVIPANDGPEGEQQAPGEGEGEAERGDGEARGEVTGPETRTPLGPEEYLGDGQFRTPSGMTYDTAEEDEVTGEWKDPVTGEWRDPTVTDQWLDVPGNPEASVDGAEQPGTDSVQNDGELAAQEPAQAERTAETPQTTAETQQPGTTPQQPAVNGQHAGADPQQAQGVPISAAARDGERALRMAQEGGRPPSRSTPQQAADTAKGAGDETGRPKGTGTNSRSTNVPKRTGRE
ncbi:hypothetical protein [Kribbella shirazensis]|uniref:Uncharacterized protein n=1 Tax=Kribbella shirazensis TaxID=1105143 RepID=A0A7X5VAT9_9ACTN|nr:hypothetical protein [Kribbella shirazensis]NIK57023.1 hypothetical protein [Kribbella shirazensis]